MPCKNADRARPVTVGFRVSSDDSETLNLLVAVSGMNKQDYIMSKILDKEMVVEPSPALYLVLKDELKEVCAQLNRLRKGENPSEHLLETCDLLGEIIMGLRGKATTSDVEGEDAAIKRLGRC